MILETGGTLLDNVMLAMKRHSRRLTTLFARRTAWLLLPTKYFPDEPQLKLP
jgi:hypothetical protein